MFYLVHVDEKRGLTKLLFPFKTTCLDPLRLAYSHSSISKMNSIFLSLKKYPLYGVACLYELLALHKGQPTVKNDFFPSH